MSKLSRCDDWASLPDDVWALIAEAIVDQGGLGTWPDQACCPEMASRMFPPQDYKASGALGARFVCRALWHALQKVMAERYKAWIEKQEMWFDHGYGMQWWIQTPTATLHPSSWWFAETWVVDELKTIARLEAMTPYRRKRAHSDPTRYASARKYFVKNLVLLAHHMMWDPKLDYTKIGFTALRNVPWEVLKWLNDLLYRLSKCPALEDCATTRNLVKRAWNEVQKGCDDRCTSEVALSHAHSLSKRCGSWWMPVPNGPGQGCPHGGPWG